VVTGVQVRLRRRWRPAPGWPPAPAGFSPPPHWSPPPTWPLPPARWTGWRVYRGRLIAAAALAILAALCVLGIRSSAAEQATTSTLTARGVTTLATVLSSSYDAGGGDPGGWSTDQISFTTTNGQPQTATVGHHNNDTPERASGRLPVIYDPTHPGTVMSVADYRYPNSAGAVVIGIAFMTFIALAAVALLLSVLKVTLTRTPTRGRRDP
jgi:hypothetical protein